MRHHYLLALCFAACFDQAPSLDEASTSTAVASTSSEGESTSTGAPTGGCAEADAIACFDFDGGDALPDDATATQLMGGALTVVDTSPFSPPHALLATIGDADAAATLHVDHGEDAVIHDFAIRIDGTCAPPVDGIVIAAFSTTGEIGPGVETTRVELVLVPNGRLSIRRAGMASADAIAEVAAPTPDAWAMLRWTTEVDGANVTMTLDTGPERVDAQAPVLGGTSHGRRSMFGLRSATAVSCKVIYDDLSITRA